MSDCLPQPGDGSQTATPSLDKEAASFSRIFADAPDLSAHTAAARRVLAMSAALFYRRGAVATSIRDITAACGLTSGALYRHFASKDDVLNAIVEHGQQAIETRIATHLELAGPDPSARTAAFVRAYVVSHLAEPLLAQVIRREYVHLSDARYRAIVRRRRALRDQLIEFVRHGVDSGDFQIVAAPEPDAARVAAVMILDMCSRTSEWFDPSGPIDAAELTDRYVQVALRMLGASAP